MQECHVATKAESTNYMNAYNALLSDGEAMYVYHMVINLTLIITTISILLSYMALEFAIPLWLGNGQTLFRFVFCVCLLQLCGIAIIL